MKKFVALLMAAMLVMSLAACGNTNANPSTSPSESAPVSQEPVSPNLDTTPSQSPNANAAGDEKTSLELATAASYASLISGTDKDKNVVTIAKTKDEKKMLVLVTDANGAQKSIYFGDFSIADDGETLTVTDDATGDVFTAKLNKDNVLTLDDGTKVTLKEGKVTNLPATLADLAK